ncbi:hypothetical protein [Bifidobacterium oedipodis]|uniref:Uncharacterized protein n=1 Tax=Bifidobacterium oedipodis TaxID=2675322 RepID=A0A7Y0HTG4_9BIFI|nr:hypothetical protein [Bifidobacterium sp. DSM 109957]NMM93649.1 hypothetical protein [Bifidobacterium sp. DSM 109957]
MNIVHAPLIDTTGGLAGNTVTPFDYGTCPCHQATQRSRDLIRIQCASTSASTERAIAAIDRSRTIAWSGKAADLFRSRQGTSLTNASLLSDEVYATVRMVGGAP